MGEKEERMAKIGRVMIKKMTESENEIKARIYFDESLIGEMASHYDERYQMEEVTLKLNPFYLDALKKEAADFFRIYQHAFTEAGDEDMEQVVSYLKTLASLDALEDTFRNICEVMDCDACLYIEYGTGTSFLPAERKNLKQIESILRSDRNVKFALLIDHETFEVRPDEMSSKDFYLMHILH
ncbi:hypothetical protein HMPREF0983_01659 [Erysipelotrichaceae bacterium 3_1_53]|nr:hypothetical protein HMPREF0983_01659 [Erysipelotrichaceae bacterium 3_1_53]